jgi:hypothetical protein
MSFNMPKGQEIQKINPADQVNLNDRAKIADAERVVQLYMGRLKNVVEQYEPIVSKDFTAKYQQEERGKAKKDFANSKMESAQKISNSIRTIQAFPYLSEELIELLLNHSQDNDNYSFGNKDLVTDLNKMINDRLPSDGIEDKGQNEFGEVVRSSVGPSGPEFMNLKALGPDTTSLHKVKVQKYVPEIGSLTSQNINVTKDKLSRKKTINFDSIMSKTEDIGHIYNRDLQNYNLNKSRIEQIIHDCEQAFTIKTGRRMSKNELGLVLSSGPKYNQIDENTYKTRVSIMSSKGDFRSNGDDQFDFINQSELKELVVLRTACKEFLQNELNPIQEEVAKTVRNQSTNVVGRNGIPGAGKFEDKKTALNSLKILYNGIDLMQDFLLETGQSDYINKYIQLNKSNIKAVKVPEYESIFTGTTEAEAEVKNNPTINEVPSFEKPVKEVVKNIEIVNNISQFVDKYFNRFDAFLLTDVKKASISNQDVLQFVGNGHEGDEVKANSIANIPTKGLSKFELQTLGKIAEKYNTIDGVQIWIGNGQIGILSSSGEMIELLQ